MKFLLAALVVTFLTSQSSFSQSQNPNIIVNGSFESGSGLSASLPVKLASSVPGWTKLDNNYFELQYEKYGNYHPSEGDVKVRLNGLLRSGIKQTVSVTPGQMYVLVFDYAPGTTNENGSFVEVKVDGASVATLSSSSDVWRREEIQVRATGPSMEIIFDGNGTQNQKGGLIDNVKLFAVTLNLSDVNLIQNGSFESGHTLPENTRGYFTALGAWKTDSASSVPVPFKVIEKDKDYPKAFHGDNFVTLDSGINSSISQTVATVSGKEYELSGFLVPKSGSSASTNTIQVFVGGVLRATLSPSSSAWRKFELSFNATSASTKIDFRASGTADGKGGSIDSLSLKKKFTSILEIIQDYQNYGLNLFSNPSFENAPAFSGNNKWGLYTSIPGWVSDTFTSTAVPFEIQRGNNISYQSREGRSKLELDSTANTKLFQEVPTVAGRQYLLEFSYAPGKDGSTTSNGAEIRWNGQVVSALNGSKSKWSDHVIQLTGIDGASKLEFFGTGTSDEVGALIDGISLREFAVSNPPLANFNITTTGQLPNLQLVIDGSSTIDDGTGLVYTWRFGGPTQTGSTNPLTTFAITEPGFYDITLVVKDADGNVSYIYKKIYVTDLGEVTTSEVVTDVVQDPSGTNLPPITIASVSTDEVVQGEAIRFDASASFSFAHEIVSYKFVFGDGTEVTTTSPFIEHIYASSGSYQAHVTVTDSTGKTTTSLFTPVTIVAPVATEAEVAASSLSGRVPFTVTLDASQSQPQGKIAQYFFDFGDGTEAYTEQAVIQHTYLTAGTYAIKLIVTQAPPGEGTSEKIVNLTVLPKDDRPIIRLNASILEGRAPLRVLFDSSLSSDDYGITAYSWDFGDGSTSQSGAILSRIAHEFTAPGTYTVLSKVKDTIGQETVIQKTVKVLGGPSHGADFVIHNALGKIPATVTFDATTPDTRTEIFEYQWSIDGQTITKRTPVLNHTFTTPGDHSISLKTIDQSGRQNTVSKSLALNAPVTFADFTYSANTTVAGATYQFDGSLSEDLVSIEKFHWDFGEGSTLELTSPTVNHLFTVPGTYLVKLTTTYVGGTSSEKTKTIIVSPNVTPVPKLLLSALAGKKNVSFNANASASFDDESIVLYDLDFGDGSPVQSSVSASEVNHVYTADGEYTIRLTVHDRQGKSAFYQTIYSTNDPSTSPVADFIPSTLEGNPKLAVNFDASGSTDDEGIVSYIWSVSNGETFSKTTPILNYTFNDPGTYQVGLTVKDADGFTSQKVTSIRVNRAPVARFTASVDNTVFPANLILDASSSEDDADGLSYSWSLDDGTSLVGTTNQSVSQVDFSERGEFVVRLKVTDRNGLSSEKTSEIRINTPPMAIAIVTPMIGDYPHTVTMNALPSSDDTGITSYRWETFEGELIAAGPVAQKTYLEAGMQAVRLIVTDDEGEVSATVYPIHTLENPVPVASFDYQLSGTTVPTTGTFDAGRSSDDRRIEFYRWNFGGTIVQTSNPKITFDFTQPGTYPVSLTVVDDQGTTNSKLASISLTNNLPPLAHLNASSLNGDAPHAIIFDASGSSDDESGIVYSWDFGDNSSLSNSPSKVSHTFRQAGTYTVSLTVTDKRGASALISKEIVITNPQIADSSVPEVFANIPSGDLPVSTSELVFAFRDETVINFDTLRLTLNGNSVAATNIVKDEQNNIVRLKFNSTYALSSGEKLRIGVRLTDGAGNMLAKGFFYEVKDSPAPDTSGPVVNFLPNGGDVSLSTTSLLLAFYDASQVDYTSIQANLNGYSVPSTLISVDADKRRAVITLSAPFTLRPNDINNLQVSVKDALGNLSIAGAGYDTRGSKIVYADIPGTSPIGSIAGGGRHVCAQNSEGIKCWGGNSFGELGYGNTNSPVYPANLGYVSVGLTPEKLYLAGDRTCVTSSDGVAKCWGRNEVGMLGLGHSNHIGDDELPSSIGSINVGGPVKLFSSGDFHSCVVRQDNNVVCWGYGGFGTLGYGNRSHIGDDELPATAGVVNTGNTSPIIQITSGGYHNCILNSEGKVKCWGYNQYRSLGFDNGGETIGDDEAPAVAPFLDFGEPVVQIATSGYSNCALLQSGTVKCWGINGGGLAGLGTNTTFLDFVSPSLPAAQIGEPVKSIYLFSQTACAITLSDSARCWGAGGSSQLGNGETQNIGDNELPSSLPPIVLPASVDSLAGTSFSVCALLSDTSLRCWGQNIFGVLGNDPNRTDVPLFAAARFYPPVDFTGNGGQNPSLSAKIAASVYSGPSPLAVDFSGVDSVSSPGQIVTYAWDFGDGSQITETSGQVSHTYQSSGVFLAKLTVTNSNNVQATVTAVISVDGGVVLPVAKIEADKDAAVTQDSIIFSGSKSFDPSASALTYHWNFGDGTVSSSPSNSVSHAYQSLGLFLATLTVESSDGRVSSPAYVPVFIKSINESPISQFSCTPGDYEISCNALTSIDYDGLIKSYEWDMGDGELLLGQNISYSYNKPGKGKFPVTLKVIDNGGLSSSTVQNFKFDNASPVITSNLASNTNYPQSKVFYTVDIADENETITEVWVNGSQQLISEESSINSYLNLQSGQNTIVVKSRDKAGNESADLTYSNVTAVNTVPSITVSGISENTLTKESAVNFTFAVNDDGLTKTSVVLNNQFLITDSEETQESLSINLREGSNRLEVVTFDESKQMTKVIYDNIVLDSTPPRLLSISPKTGREFIGSDKINFEGRASEALADIAIDRDPATLDSSKKNFTLQKDILIEGAHDYIVTLTDLAGNTTMITHNFSTIRHILYSELISLVSEGDRLKVIGQAGAARYPGQKIEISGGWFNSTEVTAQADGSFVGDIRKSTTVDLSSYAPEINFTEGHRLLFQNDTTLAGIVKDVEGTPLPGVKVSIVSTGQFALTDESGVFSIPNSSAGDQKIEIDGTSVPETITQNQKKYSRTYLNVTMGHLERNVLDEPIFLTPIYLDGSETVVEAGQPALVTSERAPGVLIEIPAGAVSFPVGTEVEVGGEMKNVINIAEIDAEKTSVPAPDFAVPDKVYSLEPSGVTFSEPVKLTLPNENEFAEGTPVIIMSKNSDTGLWEIDGAGKVNGAFIETEPGQGITHFSEVYAVPYGLEIKSRDNGELPSIDSQSGGSSTSIAMPSFKVMGQDVTPSLIYNSGWANPNAVVSNVINLVRDYQIQRVNDGANIFGVFGGSATVTFESWTAPETIKSSFYVDNVIGNEVVIDATKVPDQAVVSYAMDLSGIPSGQHSAKATYEIRYKTLTLLTTRKESNTAGIKKVDTDKARNTIYDTVFPNPVGQVIYVQNKNNSPYGRGWKLGLTQEILNPASSRLLVEESNGSPTSYILDNSIETLVYDDTGIQAAALDSSSSIRFVKGDGKVAVVNLDDDEDEPLSVPKDEQFSIPDFKVDQRIQLGYKTWRSGKKCNGRKVQGECLGNEYYEYSVGCQDNVYSLSAPKKVTDFFSSGSTAFYLDERGALYRYGSTESILAGNVGVQPKMVAPRSSAFPNLESLCKNKYGIGCSPENRTYELTWERKTRQEESQFAPSFSYCGPNLTFEAPPLTGNFPNSGYEAGTLAQAKFNDPRDVAPSLSEGDTFYIADTGNHVVRKIVVSQNAVEDFAGNRQAQGSDQGDGSNALDARIYHPKAVVTDSTGNVFIASENGIIWKVTPERKISMLAGKKKLGGPKDSEVFEKMSLSNPSGLVLDETNKILYVADTGNHRIVAMDLESKLALTVAGNYSCQAGPEFVKNGSPALDVHLCYPEKIGLDENKNLLVLDKSNKMIRRVNLKFTQTGGALYASTTKDGSKVERLGNGSFVRTYRDGTKAFFNAEGKHTSTKDRLNNTTTFQYDGEGRLISAIDPKGGESVVGYSGDKISFFRDPANRMTTFEFMGNELVSTTFPDSTQKFFEYQANGRLLSKEYNQRSFATRYEYNLWKRLSKVTRPDLSSVSSSETLTDTIANGSTTTNPKEATSYGKNNDEGNELVEIYKNATGIETKFNKDLKGYVSEITDTKNLKTKIERDNDGRPVRIDRPDSSYSTFAYNSFGDMIESYESASDTKNTFTYNPDGNPTLASTEIGAVLKTKTLQYYTNGLVFKETDYNNRSVTRQYYGNGLLFSTKNDLDEELSFQYDTKGNLYRRTAPMGEETMTVRDLAGNILRKIDSKGVTTKYTYDAFNRLTSVETGITSQRTEGDLTVYAYNEAGSLISITDPQNNVTSFEYDSMERLKKKTTHLGQVTILTYDPNGNIKTELDPNQNLKTFVYNDSDELIQKIMPGNTYTMDYDEFGNLMKVSDNDSALEYTYEKIMGEYTVTSAKSSGTDLPTVTLNYGHDDFGNRTSMSTPFGNFSYSYDHGNRLTGLTNHLSQNFNFTYDNANRLKLITRPGSSTMMDFDYNSFVTGVTHKKGSQIVNQQTFERDALGNKIRITSSRGVANFTYDQDSQLKSATNTEAPAPYQTESFNYDSLGNRTNDQLGAFAYDQKKSRLMEDYKYFYAYDDNGNMITRTAKGMSGTVTNFVYSSENQLTEIHETVGFVQTKSSEYRYDAAGRRTKKIVIDHLDGTKTFERTYVFDGNERLADYDHDNEVLAVHTHSGVRTDDTLATQITSAGRTTGLAQSSGSFFYLKDSLGSITDVVDDSGNLVQHYVYSSFGKIVKITDQAEQVTTTPVLKPEYTFTNREYDEETGLYYYRARYYEAGIGRFLQEDPDAGSAGDPQSFISKHVYVSNNPQGFVDPSGAIKIKFDFNLIIRKTILAAAGPIGFLAYDTADRKVQKIVNHIFVVGAIVAAAGFTGGLAGGVAAGAGASAGLSTLAAGFAGGIVGGVGFEAVGIGTFQEGFFTGFFAGVYAYQSGLGGGRGPAQRNVSVFEWGVKFGKKFACSVGAVTAGATVSWIGQTVQAAAPTFGSPQLVLAGKIIGLALEYGGILGGGIYAASCWQ